MIEINNLNDEAVSIFADCSEIHLKTLYEPEPGLFMAESPKVITRALNAGYEPVGMLIDKSERNAENLELIDRMELLGIPIYTAEHSVLAGITGFNMTRGALCAFRRKPNADFRTMIKGVSRIAVLEDVVNPANVGAIYRSAAALGMEAVLLTGNSTDPLYRRAARVSMGTVFQIPFCHIDTIDDNFRAELRSEGFKTVSFALRNNSVDIDDEALKKEEKLAIIMGTEGEGLKSDTINQSDFVVKIPMYNAVDSLNVAAASAIAFWELGRR